MYDLKEPVICDTGTGMIKAGFAGAYFPVDSIPGLVGRPMLRYDQALGNVRLKPVMLGHEAAEVRSLLEITYPIKNGVIQNWDDMELLWDLTFDKLKVTPSERVVVQTEAAMNPRKNREKMAEVMFEKYGFHGLNVGVQAILALSAVSKDTGLVVDSGDGVTHLVPVYQGYCLSSQVTRLNIAGRHITDRLTDLLVHRGFNLNKGADFESVAEAKQRHCYVAYDLKKELQLQQNTTVVEREYTLPDGRQLSLGAERFLAPEMLFTPGVAGLHDQKGLAETVYDCIMSSEMDLRRSFFGNIVLSGGTTMFPGTSSRLQKELGDLYQARVGKGDADRRDKMTISIEDPPRRKYMVFLGASVMAHAFHEANVHEWYVSKQEYEENGKNIVHRMMKLANDGGG